MVPLSLDEPNRAFAFGAIMVTTPLSVTVCPVAAVRVLVKPPPNVMLLLRMPGTVARSVPPLSATGARPECVDVPEGRMRGLHGASSDRSPAGADVASRQH